MFDTRKTKVNDMTKTIAQVSNGEIAIELCNVDDRLISCKVIGCDDLDNEWCELAHSFKSVRHEYDVHLSYTYRIIRKAIRQTYRANDALGKVPSHWEELGEEASACLTRFFGRRVGQA